VSVDGCTLLVSNSDVYAPHAIQAFSMADGTRLRVIGGEGDGPLQFSDPRQLCIAPDGFVFVADTRNSRVQVFIGQLQCPVGLCANADVVGVSEFGAHRVAAFDRSDGALLRRLGSVGRGFRVRRQGLWSAEPPMWSVLHVRRPAARRRR
jgi:hypothetical protein